MDSPAWLGHTEVGHMAAADHTVEVGRRDSADTAAARRAAVPRAAVPRAVVHIGPADMVDRRSGLAVPASSDPDYPGKTLLTPQTNLDTLTVIRPRLHTPLLRRNHSVCGAEAPCMFAGDDVRLRLLPSARE